MSLSLRNLLVLLVLVGCTGCGGTAAQPALTGSVFLGEEPGAQVLISLHPKFPEGAVLSALTDANGRFEMATASGQIIPGQYAICLSALRGPAAGPPGTARNDRLGGRYSDPEQPFDIVELEAGPFELPALMVPLSDKPKQPGTKP